MFDANAVKESFGRAAVDYDAHAELQHDVRGHCLQLAAQFWPKGSHILDAGCGTGAFAKTAKTLGWQITGVDLAPGMCALAASENAITLNADIQDLPLPDASFDGVFSSLTLQWLNQPADALAEMARVLKPDGHMVLSTFVEGTLAELAQAFHVVDDRPHVSRFLAPHQLLGFAKQAGLSLVVARQIRIVEYYADIIALMRRLQAIGATNQDIMRRRGLMTLRQFARLEQAYLATPRGLPVTWQALYLVLQKT